MQFPKRYLRDGTATTRRVVGVERCTGPATYGTTARYRVLDAWAGNPTPRLYGHIDAWEDGAFTFAPIKSRDGDFYGRETRQAYAGILRRAKRLHAREDTDR